MDEDFIGNSFKLRQELIPHAFDAPLFQFLHALCPLVPTVSLFHQFLVDAEKRRTHRQVNVLGKPFDRPNPYKDWVAAIHHADHDRFHLLLIDA